MAGRANDEKQDVYQEFQQLVNMTPKELEEWLETEESRSVGDKSSKDAEATGHASGRAILGIQRTKKADLSDADYAHMRKVVGYIKRHTAQRPSGDVRDTPWRHSLRNWGHDPLK